MSQVLVDASSEQSNVAPEVQVMTEGAARGVVVDTSASVPSSPPPASPIRSSPPPAAAASPSQSPAPALSPRPSPAVAAVAPAPAPAPRKKKPQKPVEPEPPVPKKVVAPKKSSSADSIEDMLRQKPRFADDLAKTIPVNPNASPSLRSPPPAVASTSPSAVAKKKPVVEVSDEEDDLEDAQMMAEDEDDLGLEASEAGGLLDEAEDGDPGQSDEEDDEEEEEDEEDEEESAPRANPRPSPPRASPSPKKPVQMEEDEEEEDNKTQSIPKKKQETEEALDEDDEMIEKMRLIEDIKDASRMGFMPPQPPHASMPIKLLRQLKQFQDEMAAQALMVGLMGQGLVSLVGVLEVLNGKFDPVKKVFGMGLKLQGARTDIAENIEQYNVPFTKIYRRMRKNGKTPELPPWAEIAMITVGILAQTHKKNVVMEAMHTADSVKRDPAMAQRAEQLAQQQRFQQQQQHMAARQQQQPQQQQREPTEEEIEARLAAEFAGFENLPSLSSIAKRTPEADEAARKAALASPPAALQAQAKPSPSMSRPAAATTTAAAEQTISLPQPKPPVHPVETITLKHAPGAPLPNMKASAALSSGEEEEEEDDDEIEESGEDDSGPSRSGSEDLGLEEDESDDDGLVIDLPDIGEAKK